MLAAVGHNSSSRTRCIFRAHGERGYTKLRNAFLQDRRISDETRGLIARLLSLPDDWEVTVQSIIASGKAGRDKVYRMLKEAEEFGYVKPERERQNGGKFDRHLYMVSDDPEALIARAAQELHDMEAAHSQPYPENPDTANPEVAKSVAEQGVSPLPENTEMVRSTDTGLPCPEKPEANKKNIEVKINNNPPIVPPPSKAKRDAIPDQYPYDFEEFWKVYPRREGKAAAFKAWKKLNLGQKRRAYVALKKQRPALLAKMNDNGKNVCPHPSTWLNGGRFDDDVPGCPDTQQKPSGMPDDVWQRIQSDIARGRKI